MALYIYSDDVNGIQAITECSLSDFILSPPDLISFNATQYALDTFGQEQRSLTETSFQIVCTFSSGQNTSGIDSPVNFIVLLQQGELVGVLGEYYI